jgi:hypothetical protein
MDLHRTASILAAAFRSEGLQATIDYNPRIPSTISITAKGTVAQQATTFDRTAEMEDLGYVELTGLAWTPDSVTWTMGPPRPDRPCANREANRHRGK